MVEAKCSGFWNWFNIVTIQILNSYILIFIFSVEARLKINVKSLKYSCQVNRVNELCITKIDVLNNLKEIKICKSYQGHSFEEINFNDSDSLKSLSLSKGDFEVFESWGDISEVKNFESMPQSLKLYIQFIEEYLEIPIKIISLGPERNQTIIR